MKGNNSIITSNFSKSFPEIMLHMFNNGDIVPSRNGDTLELLNFKTEITNPYKRCVGNNERNSNVFFLLAEAMWIWAGHKDVAFLDIFNEGMKNYSDDGINFHAPYGYRLRSWSKPSDKIFRPEKIYAEHEFDQIKDCIQLLSENSLDRRAVASIWNPLLDLRLDGKDFPCNSMLMFKVRNGKLHTTIQNRSNDLIWGLCTNVFQFSFLSEMMSLCLDLKLGTQTHNSQSLHVYVENKDYKRIIDCIRTKGNELDIYDNSNEYEVDFAFSSVSPLERLKEIDTLIDHLIASLKLTNDSEYELESPEIVLKSKYFSFTYKILSTYITYKKTKATDKTRLEAITEILAASEYYGYSDADITHSALNFFISRIKDLEVLKSIKNSNSDLSILGNL